jgi:hypothetical protein
MSNEETPPAQQTPPPKPNVVTSWLRYVGQYLSAISKGWVSLVGGVAGIVLLVLVIFWGDTYTFLKDNKTTFVWLAIICLIIAGFSAWLKERLKWERLGGGVVALSITPRELISVFKGRTTAQGEVLAKSYKGRWIRVRGPIHDVEIRYKGITVDLKLTSGAPGIVLNFDKKKWADSLSVLRQGDTISVLGQIEYVHRNHISLENCDLLEIGGHETVHDSAQKDGSTPNS